MKYLLFLSNFWGWWNIYNVISYTEYHVRKWRTNNFSGWLVLSSNNFALNGSNWKVTSICLWSICLHSHFCETHWYAHMTTNPSSQAMKLLASCCIIFNRYCRGYPWRNIITYRCQWLNATVESRSDKHRRNIDKNWRNQRTQQARLDFFQSDNLTLCYLCWYLPYGVRVKRLSVWWNLSLKFSHVKDITIFFHNFLYERILDQIISKCSVINIL